jgi:hypothetical protein
MSQFAEERAIILAQDSLNTPGGISELIEYLRNNFLPGELRALAVAAGRLKYWAESVALTEPVEEGDGDG